MNIDELDIWKPLYVDKFNTKKYLYHYTTAETAMKILHSNTLLFGKLSNTNDTTESKIRISFDSCVDNNKSKVIKDYLIKNKEGFQLLCFSMDTCVKERKRNAYMENILENQAYYDVSGRGFALPRMWAQYTNNHTGVCFILNKEKLIEKIKTERCFYAAESVSYKDIISTYHVDTKKVDSLYKKMTCVSNGKLPYLGEMANNDFLKYNFFTKSADWSNEQEYRIIIYVDNPKLERQKISNFVEVVDGLVVGERMDDSNKDILRMLLKNNTVSKKDINDKIKQICFNEQICRVK